MNSIKNLRTAVLVALAISAPTSSFGAESVRAQADERAAALVAQLTLDEKVDQLVNVAPAIPRLGIPAYNWWTESLHGALGPVPTTNFPEPIGLAASFDQQMVHDVANAISEEVRGLHDLGRKTGKLGRIGTGLDTWSPNINIFRDPRWGRGQETYGEDPFLAARLGVAYVQGMQGPNPELPNVIASPKHYAVHSGPESTRHQANVFVSAHDLEDTYLPAFRAAIVEGKAGSIMCAYNRIDGQPACASDNLLKDHLREAWNFQGYVVSDCDAVRDIFEHHKYAPDPAAAVAAALKAGVDNECNGMTLFDAGDLGVRYKEALERGLISEQDIDRSLVRLFSARYRNGDLAGVREVPKSSGSANVITPAHTELALKSAEKTLVLLKNDGVLPLQNVKHIAVIGPHADATRVLRGNYSSSLSNPPISLVDGLRRVYPNADVTLVPGAPSITDGDPIPTAVLRSPDGKPGLRAEYFDAAEKQPTRFTPGSKFFENSKTVTFKTKPSFTRIEPVIAARGGEIPQVSDYYRVVWTGFLVPQESGTYHIGLRGPTGELVLDGKTLAQQRFAPWNKRSEFATVTLEKGHRYPIRVSTEAHVLSGIEVLWKRISTQPEEDFKAGTANADVIVAAVGLTSDLEGEEMRVELEGFSGGDKTSIDLPADQRKLLEQAAGTGKPLIVVVLNGSTLDLSWAKQHAAAIIEAWYPGESGGLAIGNVIAGKTNPAGRLPLTFYKSVADLPPFSDYAMKGRTYRYFEGTPVYPFGYGLSYSKFEYAPLQVEPVNGSSERGVRVTTTVKNTSARAGEEVAQLYLTPPQFDGAPRIALRGFQRFALQPGESKQITFELNPRDLSFVRADGVRQIVKGEYRVDVGSVQPGADVTTQSAKLSIANEVELPK
ncbi:MAG TPA: glycoside hydrolase family 3 C-terminal domain-containing protein [Steroidobacteraceae bacterium]|nr:glycoside hydrolase family 3 C-terminal domain-containing protein [Steroidobacteraceae bacterium]